jgi:hypothetical protein
MKRMMALTLGIAVVGLVGGNFAMAQNQQAAKMDTAPGPAHEVIDGEVTKIEGDVYTVLSGYADNGSASQARGWGGSLTRHEYRIYVGKETKKIKGEKRVGDRVRVEVTAGGFANSIQ